MYIKLLTRLSRQRILLHILFWIMVLVFCFFVFHNSRHPLRVVATNLSFLPGHMFFVYSLNYWLFPRFVLKGKLAPSIIGFFGILIFCLFLQQINDVYFIHYSRNNTIWNVLGYPRCIFALFSIGLPAVTLRLIRQWHQEKERQQQLEKAKLTVELQLLKSQLHPHFLFNTLNSLYAFTLEKNDKAPQVVLQLSALLRYILYECNTPQIPLNTEIGIIKSYLTLESMRFGDKLESSIQFTGDIDNKWMAPLLLLPFVENSIKHGVSKQVEKSWISLLLHVAGDTIQFKLINSRGEDAAAATPAGGLGLHNVQKRLELLYPQSHTLKYTTDEDTWQVSLTIQLTPPEMQVPRTPLAKTPIIQPPKLHETQMSYR